MLVTEITAQSIDEALRKQLEALEVGVDSREAGTVIQVGDGIARVDGLKNAMAGELLEFISESGKWKQGDHYVGCPEYGPFEWDFTHDSYRFTYFTNDIYYDGICPECQKS